MAIEIRTITSEETDAYREAVMETFGEGSEADPGGAARFCALVPTAQAWAAFDGSTIVGTAATHDLAIGMPGGNSLPVAGLTMVTVRPTHRRRGLLRRLMQAHLDDARTRGLSVSGLWASEAAIYGRFGYGVAAQHDQLTVEDASSREVAGGRELDELAWIDEARAREVLPGVYAQATATRPGVLRRSATWWQERCFLESPFARRGASLRRHVLAMRADQVVGYVVFRQRPAITHGKFTGTVAIIELIAVDPRAEATLWRFALAIDLFPRVTWSNAPVDDTLAWLIDDMRQVQRSRVDNLWLRVDDPSVALAARHYAHDGRVRFEVEGTTWELVASGGTGRCTPTEAAPDLRLGRAALGSLFLGGVSASQLARAGLVHGDPAPLEVADRLFFSAVAPWCPEIF